MRRLPHMFVFAFVSLFGGTIGPLPAQTPSPAPSPSNPPLDRSILHVQVILDHLGFSPGVLDGREGQSLTAALKGFQTSRGLTVTGKMDPVTLRALYPYRKWRPTVTLALSQKGLAGPYVNPTPEDPADQAKLKTLAYRSPLEKLGEMFHTTPDVIVELNGPQTALTPGTKVVFPNALPTSRSYPADAKPEWKETLNTLNVDANVPQAKRLVVDKSEGVLKVYDDKDRLVAQFSATMGSSHDPLPIGNWKINGRGYESRVQIQSSAVLGRERQQARRIAAAGARTGRSVWVWLDLSKEHYGIHGTSAPETIGPRAKPWLYPADQLGCRAAGADGEARDTGGVPELRR